MKRIPFFLVAAVLLLTGTASASLIVHEYVAGEKVTLDDVTGKYWYWNLNDFASMTYDQQITAIGGISPTYGGIAGGWHMASLSEMEALWTYSDTNIMAVFGASGTDWNVLSYGRYDSPSSQSSQHHIAGRFPWAGGFIWMPLETYDVHDLGVSWDLGAWVTTDATVVPVPPSVVMATTGMLTGLLCMLGAKLRGRRRYGPSSI